MPVGPDDTKRMKSDTENHNKRRSRTNSLEADAHKMNLYSRQIGEYGVEAMGKLIKMRVLICGMRGLGVEVAKNLVLAGPGAVAVFDPELPSEADCGLNFFLNQAREQQETRGQASARELQKLNRLVEVTNLAELTEDVVASFSCMVVTNRMLPQDAERWNAFCRARGIGFLSADVFGPSGYVFVDFGEQFSIRDLNGETPLSRLIAEYSSVEGGKTLIRIVDDGRRHNLDESDHDGYVQFEEVPACLREALEGKVFKIAHCKTSKNKFDAYAFTIDFDSSQLNLAENGANAGGGRWTQVKRPVLVHFEDFATSKQAPCDGSFLFTDGAKLFRAEQLHCAYRALWEFQRAERRMPQSEQDVTACMQRCSALGDANFDEQVARNVFAHAAAEFQPLSAFFGGVVAQEVVKFTGKYTPLRQWLHIDAFEVLPTERNTAVMVVDQGKRQGDLRAILGDEVCDKLRRIRTFQVGCGALGCEFLKNFALLGVACGSDGGLVTVTDNDRIEVSNLSRQFLFREENVGQSKSMAAADAVRRMNKEINITALELLVAGNTESTFSNAFFASQDFILNALDNVQARNYVDGRCVFNEKPLLESGTLGTKCNVQVILPFLTQSYTDGPKDAQSADIPMCTLRNFPSEIEHCIEWARARFTDVFTVPSAQAVSFAQAPEDFLQKLDETSRTGSVSAELPNLRDLVALLKLVSDAEQNTLKRCVHDALDMFHERFYLNVLELIANYPEDTLDSTGKRFWSGTKRFPQACEFDSGNDLHIAFVLATANLLAFNRGLAPLGDELPLDSPQRRASFVLDNMAGWTARAKSPQTTSTNTSENAADEEESAEFAQLRAELAKFAQGGTPPPSCCQPCDFEKDSDLNFHIDFIYSCSNLRAYNYRIKAATRHQAKMIAGKIIPALATTTASVCGLVMIEMLKLVQGKPLEAFKDSSNSLGVNGYFFSEPLAPNRAKDEYDAIEMCQVVCDPPGFSKWDKIKIATDADVTVEDFVARFNAQAQGKYTLTSLLHPSANIETSPGYGKFVLETAPWDPKMKQEYETRKKRALRDVLNDLYGPGTAGAGVTMLETTQANAEEEPIKVPTVVWIV